MSLIEGIGDEVTHFFIVLAMILVVSVAWITTDIRQQWNIRTVYLLDRRRIRRSRSQRLTNHTESATISEGRDPVEGTSSSGEVLQVQAATREKPPETSDLRENAGDAGQIVEEDERAEIVHAMDENVIGHRRIEAFFEDEGTLIDDLIQARQFDTAGGTSDSTLRRRTTENSSEPTEMEHQTDASSKRDDASITIKLKYINDELKVVDGRLGELVGDFKRRHFEMELSSNKLVRLIFNGQVLQRDSETLESYGIFNNCVVHCLVHQQRTPPGEHREGGADGMSRSHSNGNTIQRDWDLGNLLIGSVSFCLGTAWYFRYQYPQLFTVTATVGLVAMTGVFTVISIGMYFPDVERPQTQQQQAQPQQQRAMVH